MAIWTQLYISLTSTVGSLPMIWGLSKVNQTHAYSSSQILQVRSEWQTSNHHIYACGHYPNWGMQEMGATILPRIFEALEI